MDETCSESDVSLSPSQILERLQVLRQLQLLQRGKLQKQHLQFKESSETSTSITEIVSHFSNSTSYNTFRSLLQSANDVSNECTPRLNTSDISQRVRDTDLIDGISVLNLSQESEFIHNSPLSSRSKESALSKVDDFKQSIGQNTVNGNVSSNKENIHSPKKAILLDEMPIMSPKQDFESLIKEKLQNDNPPNSKLAQPKLTKKPFLRRGEGMSRFGLSKDQLVIQNTKSLPWKKKCLENRPSHQSPINIKQHKSGDSNLKDGEPPLLVVPEIKISSQSKQSLSKRQENIGLFEQNSQRNRISADLGQFHNKNSPLTRENLLIKQDSPASTAPERRLDMKSYQTDGEVHSENNKPQKVTFQKTTSKHPIVANKANTWAAVLTKEQDEFLKQLKQSDYYKNFTSPAKSVVSDASCDETMHNLRQEREIAEQNMFELLENKVSHESFNIENSFFNRFLRSKLECSGESTPIVLQKCLALNPNMMHIYPDLNIRNEKSHSESETCYSDYTDCCSEAGSSVSCCSCKTIEETKRQSKEVKTKEVEKAKTLTKRTDKEVENKSHDDTMTENDNLKASMAQMNEKLIATSELMKERLHELEDEIETFRKENSNLTTLREELDQERHKFYEEKAVFEQKFNEEKVLSEYYLAEEKEKLSKQKQMYDRYVREMRGRLNKKDKDEVINLKKEINDMKEEMRLKDAKSTSTIARLRNQIKILEKEKKELHDEVEKLKKQNRRIQHSNEVTRRLTNIKYLEEINKKLTNMTSKETRSEVGFDSDAKYKAYEIERQSRSRRIEPAKKAVARPRAKSVPNLNVTSRYAKYFSQRDTVSQMEQNKLNVERVNTETVEDISLNDSGSLNDLDSDHDDEDDSLEKLYLEKFRSASPTISNSRSNGSISDRLIDKLDLNENAKSFFINKPRSSKSPKESVSPYQNTSGSSVNRSHSPVSILSNKSNSRKSPNFINSTDNISNFSNNPNRSKSPASYVSRSSNQMTSTVIHNEMYRDKLSVLSPEPASSKTSLKTNLNPVEIKNADGSRELRFPNGNIKYLSADGKYSKFVYYNGDVKENFYNEGRIKYFYAETKTYHTTHADGLEVLEFPDGQIEKRYKDGSSEIRLPNGSVRYYDPKNEHVREEWRFPDGAAMTVAASGEQRIVFGNGQVEVHAKDHKRREFPDGTVKLVYNDGTSETRYASGRVRIKDKHGHLIMDSTSR